MGQAWFVGGIKWWQVRLQNYSGLKNWVITRLIHLILLILLQAQYKISFWNNAIPISCFNQPQHHRHLILSLFSIWPWFCPFWHSLLFSVNLKSVFERENIKTERKMACTSGTVPRENLKKSSVHATLKNEPFHDTIYSQLECTPTVTTKAQLQAADVVWNIVVVTPL